MIPLLLDDFLSPQKSTLNMDILEDKYIIKTENFDCVDEQLSVRITSKTGTSLRQTLLVDPEGCPSYSTP